MAINVVIKALFDDVGIKEAEKAFGTFGQGVDRAFRAVTIGAGIAGAAIGKFGVDSIKAASDLAESTNAVNVAFGDAAQSVLKLGETSAESMGVSQTAFNQAAVRFSAFAERVVGSGGDVAGFISDISTRAADFASVFNIDVSEALQVFQSGLSGEAEPLKRFGINLLDTEVKAFALRTEMIKQGQTLTEVQKVQARYGLLLESTNKVQGDFANTSDGLANSQRILTARFEDMQAEIGTALLPAVTELVTQVGDRLMPVFEDFGKFLASPEGKKIIQDTADAIADFAVFLIDNIDEIADFAIKAAAAITVLYGLKTALEFATTAQLLFNVAVKANPYVIAATALAALVGGIFVFSDAMIKSGIVTEKTENSIEDYAFQAEKLRQDLESGLITQSQYDKAIAGLKTKFEKLSPSIESTAGELNRLNNISLDKFRSQLGDTRVDAERLAYNAKQLAFAMKGIFLPDFGETTGGGGGGGGGGGTGETAFKKVQKFIKDSQADLAKAQKAYNEEVKKINKDYTENVLKTQKQFADRLDNIVTQSIDRLRSAYSAAVTTNVGTLFDAFKSAEQQRKEAFDKARTDLVEAQEKLKEADADLKETLADPKRTTRQVESATKAFDTAKAEFEKLSGIVSAGLVEKDPVENLVDSLQKKLRASQSLLSNSAELASNGFSQTFIEQIVATGTDTGNELAAAILNATPDVQRELQSLFSAIETQADSGIDSLARQIYEKNKLATAELTRLYEDTQEEGLKALAELKTDFDNQLIDANLALIDAIKEIRTAFNENIESMKGDLGGLDKAVADFLKKLGKAEADAQKDVAKIVGPTAPSGGGAAGGGMTGMDVAISTLSNVTGYFIDSVSDIAKLIGYLNERIVAANKFANEAAIAGRTTEAMSAVGIRRELESQLGMLQSLRTMGAAAVGTTININVKTDPSQSLAMVGKTLGNTITKYVTSGGQVLVSPTN